MFLCSLYTLNCHFDILLFFFTLFSPQPLQECNRTGDIYVQDYFKTLFTLTIYKPPGEYLGKLKQFSNPCHHGGCMAGQVHAGMYGTMVCGASPRPDGCRGPSSRQICRLWRQTSPESEKKRTGHTERVCCNLLNFLLTLRANIV